MARCDRISIYDLVAGYLTAIELECLNEVAAARQFTQVDNSAYSVNQAKYTEWKLSTVRSIRHRIPAAWRKCYVTTEK